MADARSLQAGLSLLDRQLVDRDGKLCGKVDDLELTPLEGSNDLYVSAVLTGPGALHTRHGWTGAGRWLRKLVRSQDPERDRGRIPFGRVTSIDNHVALSSTADELATDDTERWVRDHIVRHIPGSNVDADQ
jgi:sporulation protein YlmC with PRC-barrel domain